MPICDTAGNANLRTTSRLNRCLAIGGNTYRRRKLANQCRQQNQRTDRWYSPDAWHFPTVPRYRSPTICDWPRESRGQFSRRGYNRPGCPCSFLARRQACECAPNRLRENRGRPKTYSRDAYELCRLRTIRHRECPAQAWSRFDSRFNLFIQNVAFVLVEFIGKNADDAITRFAFKRKENHERIWREANVQRVVTHLPINLCVGNVKGPFEGAAFKLKTQNMPHQTLRTVAADNVFRRHCSRFVVGGSDLGYHAIRVLFESFEFGFPQNVLLMALQILVKQPFGLALFQHQHKRKGTHPFADLGKSELAAYFAVNYQASGPATVPLATASCAKPI